MYNIIILITVAVRFFSMLLTSLTCIFKLHQLIVLSWSTVEKRKETISDVPRQGGQKKKMGKT